MENDITQDLFEQLKMLFIDPILDVPSFVKDERARKVYMKTFQRTLESWEGNFTECLVGSLDDKQR